jgi:dual oxidase
MPICSSCLSIYPIPRFPKAVAEMAEDQYLTEKEIDDFLNDLDKNNNGYIDYVEVERKLDEVHKEIAPEPKPHHFHHEDGESFYRAGPKVYEDHKEYIKSMSWGRRFRAYWSVEEPEALSPALVISMQVAFGTWQLMKYLSETQYRHVGIFSEIGGSH